MVILIADGYKNINNEFKSEAERLGIFRESAIKETFLK